MEALVHARTLQVSSPVARLTARERQVLELIAASLPNTAIAERLALGDRAVEKHIGSVFTKIDLGPDDPHTHRRVRAVLVYLASLSG